MAKNGEARGSNAADICIDRGETLGIKRAVHPLRLGVFDIDGTLRTAKDPWIHLHEHLGFTREAHEHKDLFFAGKIDYKEWVDRDAALWKGFHRTEILKALDTNPLKPGAAELLGWFRSRGIPMIGISTGLDVFNGLIGEQFGFDTIRSNELHFDDDGYCLGTAHIHVREDGKGSVLEAILRERRIQPECIAAFGDGSADIQLFKLAGLSVAISPSKETIRQAATHCLMDGSLEAAVTFLADHFVIDPDAQSRT